MTRTTYDVAVVGGGAAGLNGALVLARAGRRTIVIDAGAPRNRFADHMHGFLSREGMAPSDLLAIGRQEVEGYDGAIRQGEVVEIVVGQEGERFGLRLAGGDEIVARRVLLATGARDELPEIPGLRELWGRTVLHCPYCHGFEVRGQPLGVIAVGPHSVHHGLLIRQWSDDLVYFTNGVPLDAAARGQMTARGTRVIDGHVRRLLADADGVQLTGVELEDGTVVARTAVFTGSRIEVTAPWLERLGVTIDRNAFGSWVVTNPLGATNIAGIWAAGNVAEPMAQVIAAAAAGARIGAVINYDLVEEETRQAVAAFAP